MKKKFRIVAGVKFLCDDKGVLLKNAEGEYQEVPETETDAEEVEVTDEAVGEVEKMLREATAQVKRDAEKAMDGSAKKASDAIIKMLDSVASAATKNTKVLDSTTEKASFDVDSVLEGIKEFAEGKREKFTFAIKSVKDLNFLKKTTSESDSLTGDVIEPQRVPELTRDPVRSVFIESIADVTSNMTSDSLSYVEVVNESGAPLPTAELATISEKDFEFQEFKAPLKKITVMNKHSVEILKDAPQLVNAIKAWLQEDINIVTDQQLINGNGVGDNLQGVFGVASVLDGSSIGSKRVEFANLADVLRVAITKIAVSGKGKFVANYVLLNPADADELDLTKDENGQYVLPPFKSADGNVIKGARIIENVGIPAGTFLVGDFRKLHLGTKGGVEIEMTNSDGTDFAKDILSVKLRRRVASYVRQNDSGAFWTGNIATCKAALTQS
jgi:HK97 family phage major capsid protein